MTCPVCHQKTDQLYSAVRDGEFISRRCQKCSFAGFADNSRKFARDYDKRDRARSLIQPWEPEFIKEYGYDKAKDAGWSDSAIRRYS